MVALASAKKKPSEMFFSGVYSYSRSSFSSEATEDTTSFDLFDEEPSFGLCFDIDGVLARGTQPIEEAKKAFRLMSTSEGILKVPVVFVTNGVGCSKKKAELLEKWLEVKISPSQMIFAPSPLSVFTSWHEKRILIVGQGDVVSIATNLGFKRVTTLAQVCKAFPHLDYVNHEYRKKLGDNFEIDQNFERIEALLLIGEPVNWEAHLQVLIDLLISNGLPESNMNMVKVKQLPVLACNMDLVFMAKAKTPRFGHGAFLACLETLYERITGSVLVYQSIIGKPSEVTYRYAEHVLTSTSRAMGYSRPIHKIYFFGDNPEVDILGANLYNNYLSRYRRLKNLTFDSKAFIANSRAIPESDFMPQTAKAMYSILVRTGVYKPDQRTSQMNATHCHRDFRGAADLVLPSFEVEHVLDGIALILRDQNFDISRVTSE